MCCKNRGPRCSTCHKPAPRHSCRCPAKYASSSPTINTKNDGLPSYAAAMSPQPQITAPLPLSVQPRYGGRGCGGCGSRRRRGRGPIHLLVSLIVRKVQEKEERERQAANSSEKREGGVQERGVIEAADEKPIQEGVEQAEKSDEDIRILTKSVRSMSL